MKYLLLIAVILFLLVAPWCIRRVGRRNELSISLHVADSKFTMWVFGIVGTIATIFAALALFGTTLPSHGAPIITYIIFAAIILEIAISTLIPHIDKTWRGTVHSISAWGLCFSIPLAILSSLLLSLNPFAFWYVIATLLIEIILLIMALGWPSLRKWFLQFQSSYLLLFFMLLIVVTFN